MSEINLEYVRKRIGNVYQANKRLLNRAEKRSIETPTEEGLIEAAELRGVLRGINKSLACLEVHAADNTLPMEVN